MPQSLSSWLKLFILVLLINLGAQVQAKPIVDIENVNNYIDSISYAESKLIESCIDGHCQIFPHEKAHLIGFTGTNEQWRNFFYHCAQFSHLNNLTLGTQIAASLLTLGLLTKAGLLIKGSQVLTGLVYGGAEASVNQFSSAYPRVDKALLSKTAQNARAALKKGPGNYLQHKTALIHMTQTFKACSSDFLDNFTTKNLQEQQDSYNQRKSEDSKKLSIGKQRETQSNFDKLDINLLHESPNKNTSEIRKYLEQYDQ